MQNILQAYKSYKILVALKALIKFIPSLRRERPMLLVTLNITLAAFIASTLYLCKDNGSPEQMVSRS